MDDVINKLISSSLANFLKRSIGEPKTERATIFVVSKWQIFVNKLLQNNFERWNSACQSFNLTTMLSNIRVSKNFCTSEVHTCLEFHWEFKSSFFWRFDYLMRAQIWMIDWTIFWVLFTNITILKCTIFYAFRFLVHLILDETKKKLNAPKGFTIKHDFKPAFT